jgi:putative transposase
MCKALRVSKSGYYKYINRKPNEKRLELEEQIKYYFNQHKTRFGAKKLSIDINKQHKISTATIGRYMRKLGLAAKNRAKHKTNISKEFTALPNILNREFKADKPNEKWVSDITYIWSENKWHYLCVILDLYSRKVISWKFSPHMETSLVLDTLNQAIILRNIDTSKVTGLLFHSDQGSQYTSNVLQQRLKFANIVQSMSRRGNCWDNAVAESFFKSLKAEMFRC